MISLPMLHIDSGQRSLFLVLTKTIGASGLQGDERETSRHRLKHHLTYLRLLDCEQRQHIPRFDRQKEILDRGAPSYIMSIFASCYCAWLLASEIAVH